MIADNTAALFDTVVVYGNCTASDVCTLSDIGITDVSEVSDSCLFAYGRILDLNEVADLSA